MGDSGDEVYAEGPHKLRRLAAGVTWGSVGRKS
jgi:hypothetical protein